MNTAADALSRLCSISLCPGTTVDTPVCPIGPADQHQTRLGISYLDQTVHRLIGRGVTQSTLTAYDSGKRRYLAFCTQFNIAPLPTTEPQLLHFEVCLFQSSLSYQSIKSYLSAVRHLQIVSGYPDPALSSLPCLTYALQGIQRDRPAGQRHTRLPITPELLTKIFRRWSSEPVTFDRVMLWAAFCLGFGGFMRVGEFTCPSLCGFSPDMLTPGDVAIDSILHHGPPQAQQKQPIWCRDHHPPWIHGI